LSTLSILFSFAFLLVVVFVVINFIFANRTPYMEKFSIFECGFHSFLGQNRSQFGIKFFIFGLLYLLLDLEIVLVYPYGTSVIDNEIYGLITFILFIIIISVGFIFEIGKNALYIDSKQHYFIQ
jgi:NADH-ubiquinone oxidoreductase chain 3